MIVADGAMPDLIWLSGAGISRAAVGGKGASLASLTAIGAPVPAAFAVTTDVYRRMARDLHLPRAVAGLSDDDVAAIRAAITRAELPRPLRDQIALAGTRLSRGQTLGLAVRSSATTEDSTEFSFAGLHDTVLEVRGTDALEAAIKRCWASLWTERAVAYRRRSELAGVEAAIAVVVQQMVQSDVSFVAFTADPVSGRSDRLVIDATWGLGEALVSGLVTPDHVVVGAEGRVMDYVVGEKAVMVIPGADNGETREVPVPRALRAMPALAHTVAERIASTARHLAHSFGYAADIEGGIRNDELFIFQARPITTVTGGAIAA